MSDINITPFVDVLLVLLIIFMVAAPLLTGTVNVDLPKGSKSKTNDSKKNPISVSIKKNSNIYVNDKKVASINSLSDILMNLSNNNKEKKIYVKGDKSVDYGLIMGVIKEINESGFQKVILVTDISK